jgi:surfactin synthase thioesterase subunit
MVPSAFHWQEVLPLTGNGKIDRAGLTTRAAQLLAGEPDIVEQAKDAPRTPTEQRLATAWASVLALAPDQIARSDDFFDRGGTSLAAVRLAIALDRAVSLKDLTRHPVLADLAAVVDGRAEHRVKRRSGLLQPLSEPDGAARCGAGGALVCFPYGGGNAVSFRQLAMALRSSGMAVYAVELPGHELPGHELPVESNPFKPLAEVVEQVVVEITGRGLPRIQLWGHSLGAAFAVETARVLAGRGVDVRRVFLAAQLIGDAAARRAAIRDLTARSNAEIAAALSSDTGYTELGEPDPHQGEHLGAAYRHDGVTAHRYLSDILDNPPEVKLSAPVSVVVADDDPGTEGYPDRYRDWGILADHVDLHVLPGGGHYFLRSCPAETAKVVLRAAGLMASSLSGQST